MYDVKQQLDEPEGSDDGATEDIESSIKKELDFLNSTDANAASQIFTTVRLNVECVLFVKTRGPIDPVELVHRVCEDANAGGATAHTAKTRYINRLTPVTLMGRANGKAIEEVARKVLAAWFDLKGTSQPRSDGGGSASPKATRAYYSVRSLPPPYFHSPVTDDSQPLSTPSGSLFATITPLNETT